MKLFTWPYLGQDALAQRDFQDDEQALTAVKQFFSAIDGTSTILLIISIVLPAVICIYYHKGFNNKPGRHYIPKYQFMFFLVSAAATLVVSWIVEIAIVKLPPVDGNFGVFRFLVAIGSMCFGMVIYTITALVFGFTGRTNAFPLHKLLSKK